MHEFQGSSTSTTRGPCPGTFSTTSSGFDGSAEASKLASYRLNSSAICRVNSCSLFGATIAVRAAHPPAQPTNTENSAQRITFDLPRCDLHASQIRLQSPNTHKHVNTQMGYANVSSCRAVVHLITNCRIYREKRGNPSQASVWCRWIVATKHARDTKVVTGLERQPQASCERR